MTWGLYITWYVMSAQWMMTFNIIFIFIMFINQCWVKVTSVLANLCWPFWPRLCVLLLNSPRTLCICLISLLAPCSKCRFCCCFPYRTRNLLRTRTCISPSNLDHQGKLTKCLEHYKVFNKFVCLSCLVGDQNTKVPSLPYLLELKYCKKRKTNCWSKYCSKRKCSSAISNTL